MPKVLITGMSGTGKSAALLVLAERGHRTVDTDTDEWSHWVTEPDGSPDWVWREDAMTRLLAGHRGGHLFVAGCKTNQGRFYPQFDHVALLSAPAPVLARISTRTSNPYGKHPGEQDLILRHLAEVEPLLRASATIEIDASAPWPRSLSSWRPWRNQPGRVSLPQDELRSAAARPAGATSRAPSALSP